jgi:hypothetical protein
MAVEEHVPQGVGILVRISAQFVASPASRPLG